MITNGLLSVHSPTYPLQRGVQMRNLRSNARASSGKKSNNGIETENDINQDETSYYARYDKQQAISNGWFQGFVNAL